MGGSKMDKRDFSNAFARARDEAGLSRKQLAGLLDISATTCKIMETRITSRSLARNGGRK
jgi:DNA-binding XRE family transcriptional regulator